MKPNRKPLKICFDRVIPGTMAAARHLAHRSALADALHELGAPSARHALADIDANAPGVIGRPRMALINSRKWENGHTLRCRFLQGSKKQKAGVIKHAEEWLEYANLKLKFVDSDDAEVRIAFIADDGSWSAVGTDALVESYFPKHQPTMNYGWLEDTTPDSEYRRVVVHEFGHAIGCVHEHQSPTTNLKWNKEQVYKYFSGSPNFWSKAEIDENVLRKYSPHGMSATMFDAKSIMLYEFPAELFTNGKATPNNTRLSKLDIQMIGEMYPYPLTQNKKPVKAPGKAKAFAFFSKSKAKVPETALEFVLRLIDETGYLDGNGNKVGPHSSITKYFKEIEEIDEADGMDPTRTGKFVLQYTNHFPGVAMSINMLTSGGFGTPLALAKWAA